MSKSIFEQHQAHCVHFNGLMNKKCEAGINYMEIAKVPELGRTGYAVRLPCLKSHYDEEARRGQPLCACEKIRWPTKEESEQHQRECDVHTRKFTLALPIIGRIKKEHKADTGDWKGTVGCPACGGVLHVMHSSYNGHVWGKCETDDCLGWME